MPNLLSVCERLIVKGETLEYLENALKRFPTLLTLEDFVVRHGVPGASPKILLNWQRRVSNTSI